MTSMTMGLLWAAPAQAFLKAPMSYAAFKKLKCDQPGYLGKGQTCKDIYDAEMKILYWDQHAGRGKPIDVDVEFGRRARALLIKSRNYLVGGIEDKQTRQQVKDLLHNTMGFAKGFQEFMAEYSKQAPSLDGIAHETFFPNKEPVSGVSVKLNRTAAPAHRHK
jgi:hypothetical protein